MAESPADVLGKLKIGTRARGLGRVRDCAVLSLDALSDVEMRVFQDYDLGIHKGRITPSRWRFLCVYG